MSTPEYDFSLRNLRIDLKRPSISSGTPTKTRGRKPPQTQSSIPPSRTKRPKAPSENSLPQPATTHTRSTFSPDLGRSSKNTNCPRPLSPIERLPFDILEHVFLECLNVNFPRALQRVGQVLSTDRVYRHFAYRIYCTNIHKDKDGAVTLTPPGLLKDSSERERITRERDEMVKARSAGLTCRWATYGFFKALHQQTTRTPDRWMGLFSCSIPRKLLKPPLHPSNRKLLLALASLGAKLDSRGLSHEDADSLWVWAATVRDLFVLQCLMEPRFGFKPSREQRLEALGLSNYNLDMVRLFKDTRAQDPKSGWMWDADWPEGWPLGDAKVEAELCERYGVEFAQLKGLIDSGSYLRDWKVGFGGDIPGSTHLES